MQALGAITWDPEIRGALIVLTAVLILCGSVYLLLATNLGARLGFLVAAAGLAGWMATLGLIWTVYGIGNKGPEPTWKLEAINQGPLSDISKPPLDTFPQGWKKLPEGDPMRAEAQAAVDEQLKSANLGFTGPSDYIVVDAYDRGGEKHNLFGASILGKGLTYKHSPQYAAVRVQPTIKQEAKPGEKPPTPKADPSKPVVTVLLIHDLGAKRLPPFLTFVASSIVFGVVVWVLHRRDKMAMAARGSLPAGAR